MSYSRIKVSIYSVSLLVFLTACSFSQSEKQNNSTNGFEAIFNVAVESEDTIYSFKPADNGADPLWCFGSTCIIRQGDKLFASGIETVDGVKPSNNVRWMLFENSNNKWKLLQKDTVDWTREPCPMGVLSDSSLFMTVNPSLSEPGTIFGYAQPQVLKFSIDNPTLPAKTILPKWEGEPDFTEHSYRNISCDGLNNEMILFNNIDDKPYVMWTFRDSTGNWSAQGKLEWPWGSSYEKPQPIRLCYPSIQLKDRQVHFLGVSDLEEPNSEWRKYKFEQTGNEWDYDFRRLFYTYSPDIITGKFTKWVEIANRDSTAGKMFPIDMWVSPQGFVHVMWIEKAINERMREKYFPEAKQYRALNYAVIKDGKVIYSKPIMGVHEGESTIFPGRGRFHVTPDNRLFVIYYVSGNDSEGEKIMENRIVEIGDGFKMSKPIKLDMKYPLRTFFTAGVRGGNAPSNIIDIMGYYGYENIVRHAKIRIKF